MYKRRRQQQQPHQHQQQQLQQQQHQQQRTKVWKYDFEEVSSIEWEMINMTDQEEDLIYRMYRLVGDRWALIAGRIPGRKPEEIERYWLMKHGEGFSREQGEVKPCKDFWRR